MATRPRSSSRTRRAARPQSPLGPDGNFWFTEGAASRIGRITPSGEITEFALPPGRHPGAIVAGADGNLWFTERVADRVGRITTSGLITEFLIPGPEVEPVDIAAGPDGNLWFAQEEAAKIGRITPRGAITQFGVPIPDGTQAIVSGPEGKLWFAAGNLVGAISTNGAVSWPACLLRYCRESPAALGVGPEGALWVGTDYQTCKGLCGGGTTIGLTLRPGGIGRYELPPVKLGLGPRATLIRKGATSLLLACGLPGGCRGQLRVTRPEWPHGHRRNRVLGKPFTRCRRGRHGESRCRSSTRRSKRSANGRRRPATTPTLSMQTPAPRERSKRAGARSSSPSPGALARATVSRARCKPTQEP